MSLTYSSQVTFGRVHQQRLQPTKYVLAEVHIFHLFEKNIFDTIKCRVLPYQLKFLHPTNKPLALPESQYQSNHIAEKESHVETVNGMRLLDKKHVKEASAALHCDLFCICLAKNVFDDILSVRIDALTTRYKSSHTSRIYLRVHVLAAYIRLYLRQTTFSLVYSWHNAHLSIHLHIYSQL